MLVCNNNKKVTAFIHSGNRDKAGLIIVKFAGLWLLYHTVCKYCLATFSG